MNWLIYIGGWVVFGYFIELIANIIISQNNSFFHTDKNIIARKLFGLIFWTMTWIWICWKFIR